MIVEVIYMICGGSGYILPVEWGTGVVIRVSDEVEEFRVVVNVFTSVSCREQVIGEMIHAFPLPLLGVKESLNPPSRAFDRVRMNPIPLK
jgi:hypothetical protein